MHRRQQTYAEFEITLTGTLLKIPHNRPLFFPQSNCRHSPAQNLLYWVYLLSFQIFAKRGKMKHSYKF